MKTTKKLLFVIITFTVFIVIQSCKNNEKPEKPTMRYTMPTGLLIYEEANQKEETYKTYIHDVVNPILTEQEIPATINREIWFDLDNLENYIKYVKKESKKKGYKNLGLRVYLGAAKEEKTIESTVFFTPTHKPELPGDAKGFAPPQNENSRDINSLNYGSAGKPPKDL